MKGRWKSDARDAGLVIVITAAGAALVDLGKAAYKKMKGEEKKPTKKKPTKKKKSKKGSKKAA